MTTLAKRIVILAEMNKRLSERDTYADNESVNWTSLDWEEHAAESTKLEDEICAYEHTPLMFSN